MNQSITIITPSYNRAETLTRVFESLQNQTFKDFIWLVMDDGSTDNTQEVMDELIKKANFEIQYHYHENIHKFVTVLKGVKKVTTPYFVFLDSDDQLTNYGLEKYYQKAEEIKNDEKIICILSHSIDKEGNLVGTLFPENIDYCSNLDLRFKYKVQGDKSGLFFTDRYKQILYNFDYEPFIGRYTPQKVFYSIYDSKGYKCALLNETIRIYHFDPNDEDSMTSERTTSPSAYFGMMHTYLSTLNNYQSQLWKYPKYLIRNTIGALFYGFKQSISPWATLSKIQYFPFKLLAITLIIPTYLYYLLNK